MPVFALSSHLTAETRTGLMDGLPNLVLSHPMQLLVETVVEAMAHAIERIPLKTARQVLLPFDIYTPRNVSLAQ